MPWLIAGASSRSWCSGRPASWRPRARAHHPDHRDPRWLPLGTFAIAIYGGYFGAAAGVLLLAMYLLATGEGLPRGNAMRTWSSASPTPSPPSDSSCSRPIAWSAALPLAIGLFAGRPPRPPGGAPRAADAAPPPHRVAGLGLAINLGIQAYF